MCKVLEVFVRQFCEADRVLVSGVYVRGGATGIHTQEHTHCYHYQITTIQLATPHLLVAFASVAIRYRPARASSPPCPMSPYITPKRNGKVAAVKRAGFASRYRGIPYVFTNSWNAYVYLFTVKWVGAVGQLSGTFSIIAWGNWVIGVRRDRG
jgi:hypothetical protein